METRKLYEIAREIRADWEKNINYAARPYLEAMEALSNIKDSYYQESGVSIVLYFLANARYWRGETARRVKMELKKLAGVK